VRETTDPRDLLADLVATHERVRALADGGRIDPEALHRLADLEAIAAFDLHPRPTDPAVDVREGYAFIRRHLERLADHDQGAVAAITSADGYTYTFRPRSVLRRVLDHLNQIEQWVTWQADGTVPTPTDGWASFADVLEEDNLPLSAADLRAWLWRIDRVWELLANRADALTAEQLDWVPPGDDWNLRRVLHHVGRGFYAAWLDGPLPEEPAARFGEASARLGHSVRAALDAPLGPDRAYYGNLAEPLTLEVVLQDILETADALLESGDGRPAPVERGTHRGAGILGERRSRAHGPSPAPRVSEVRGGEGYAAGAMRAPAMPGWPPGPRYRASPKPRIGMKMKLNRIKPTAKPVLLPKDLARSSIAMMSSTRFTPGMRNRSSHHHGRPIIRSQTMVL